MKTISIDGSSGGGQILRSSLTLSLITRQPFHMVNIRGARPKPGLMRQHLTCVQAAAEIGKAEVSGAELGSKELRFAPEGVQGGAYQFNIGSGGGATLVLQTLLPALLYADKKSTLRIEGGTHNPLAPPYEFIEQCYLPILHKMGAQVSVALIKPGFMQAGGGVLTATISPLKKWLPVTLLERGALVRRFGLVLHAMLPESIAERERHAALKRLQWEAIEIREVTDSVGPGSILMLGAEFEHSTEISSSVARFGRPAESVGASAAKGLLHFLASRACVGVHLADQLLLPMALAGSGSFRTLKISKHLESSLALIPRFLPVTFQTQQSELGFVDISV